MAQGAYILAAIAIGVGMAMQLTMIAAMSRTRGPLEATWVSLMATITGVAVLLTIRALQGATISLPGPLDRTPVLALTAVMAAAALIASMRGLPLYFAGTGVLPIPLLVGAGILAPRIGIGLFLSSAIAGQLMGSVALDHLGAFGSQVRPIDALRITGVATLLLGVVLVRGIR